MKEQAGINIDAARLKRERHNLKIDLFLPKPCYLWISLYSKSTIKIRIAGIRHRPPDFKTRFAGHACG
jgi:hypothetical protein